MIERPEAVTLARQIGEHLKGARVVSAARENSPHKWAFYNRPREDYETIPVDKRIGEVDSSGSLIFISLEPSYVMQLGEGGERISLLDPGAPLPR
jgi:hypothetical protein